MTAKFWSNLSQEYGLYYVDKRLFGWLSGYHITLSTVSVKAFRLHVYLPMPDMKGKKDVDQYDLQKSALLRDDVVRALDRAAKKHKLRRTASATGARSVFIEFECRGKIQKNLGPFLHSAVSGIASLGIQKAFICSHCAKPLENHDVPVRIKNDVFPMHDHCANEITYQKVWPDDTKKGSITLGIVGAALGAIVGAVPMAVLYALDYSTNFVGIFIGYVVSKGYDILKGKKSRTKIPVILLFIVLSVALGQATGSSYNIIQIYNEIEASLATNEYMIYSKAEFLQVIWTQAICFDPEALSEILISLTIGVFFALLGCIPMVSDIIRNKPPKKPKRLTTTM